MAESHSSSLIFCQSLAEIFGNGGLVIKCDCISGCSMGFLPLENFNAVREDSSSLSFIGFDSFRLKSARNAVIPLIVSLHYIHCKLFLLSTSCAASIIPILPLWKLRPPCIHTAKGSRSGASAEISIDEPDVKAPAAMITLQG